MTNGSVHKVHVEERLDPPPVKRRLPLCPDGAGACPPEECGGPAGYLARRDDARGIKANMDVALIADTAREVVDGTIPAALIDADERAWPTPRSRIQVEC